jgi:hypothetical protein
MEQDFLDNPRIYAGLSYVARLLMGKGERENLKYSTGGNMNNMNCEIAQTAMVYRLERFCNYNNGCSRVLEENVIDEC